jgi:oligoribonuclease (3'-5' exoribonuclease)
VKFAAPQTAIFLDLETTGLNPSGQGAALLEIGMLAVEVPTFREIDSWSSVIVELDRLEDPLKGCDDYVRNMHQENGLKADLEAVIAAARPAGKLPRLFNVQQAAVDFYNKHASGRKVYMGGANPSFDKGWLDRHMPTLARKFSHRNLDVNAFFILKEYLVGPVKSGTKHRALDDCRQSVQAVHDHFTFMRECFGAK